MKQAALLLAIFLPLVTLTADSGSQAASQGDSGQESSPAGSQPTVSREVTGLFSARYVFQILLSVSTKIHQKIKELSWSLCNLQQNCVRYSRIAYTETTGFIPLFLIIRIPLPDYAELRQCNVLTTSETL